MEELLGMGPDFNTSIMAALQVGRNVLYSGSIFGALKLGFDWKVFKGGPWSAGARHANNAEARPGHGQGELSSADPWQLSSRVVQGHFVLRSWP